MIEGMQKIRETTNNCMRMGRFDTSCTTKKEKYAIIYHYFFYRGSLTTNGHLPREVTQSERDLTKVTKVRVRTNNAKDQQQQLMSTSSSTGAIFKPRTKMKTTTMIINQEVVDLTKETKISTTNNVDVVRAPLNWQLVDQTASQLQKVNKCDF